MDSTQGTVWYCLVLANQKAGRCGRRGAGQSFGKMDVILREDKVTGLEPL